MQFRLRGLSWRAVARDIGVSPQAVQHTASGRPSVPIERAISALLGLEPEQLFPEHWSPEGRRIPVERTSLHKAKHSVVSLPRHVQTREVA